MKQSELNPNNKIPENICARCLGTNSYVMGYNYKRKKCNHKLTETEDKWLRKSNVGERRGML